LINRLVFENLRHRKLRTGLSALSIGFQVTMILAVVGLSHGMLKDSADRAKGVGADIWVKPPHTSLIGLSAATMPAKLLENYFLKQPHVIKAVGTYTVPLGGVSTLTGIDYKEFTALSGPLKFIEGHPFRSKTDVIVDRWYSETYNKHVGDTVKALEMDWHICGVVEPGKLARMFVPIDTLQDKMNTPGKVSQALLKVDNPANTRAVIASMKADLLDYNIYSIEELVSQFSIENVAGLKAFIYVIIGLSIIIGFLVVSLTMYTTVLERTREIGILKALGASPADIMGLLVRETMLLALAGWIAGILISFGANWAINHFVRASLQSVIAADWWFRVAIIAVTASLLGALYPGMRAARQDAIEALAYE
jgi:putative ABC transport system permease protein